MKDAFVKIPGWLLFWYLLVGQCIPAIDYEIGIRMGTQDPPEVVTPIGVAFWKGFATADLVFYVPLLGYGLWTYETNSTSLSAALGVTVYWPMVCLVAAIKARGTEGWSLDDRPFCIILPIFILWASLALAQMSTRFVSV